MESFNDTAIQVIQIHPQAPAKPDWAAPCNGCGVCCLAVPCPVGMLVSRRRSGPCRALQWQESGKMYRCGLLQAPSQRLQHFSKPMRALLLLPAALLAWLARRWISAGSGCDSTLDVFDSSKIPSSVLPHD